MGRIKAFIFFITVFATNILYAQDSSAQPKAVKTITGSFKNFYTDPLGNVYLLGTNNRVLKLNADFDSAGVFNDVRRYGDVFGIDASNPLKLLVYYKDFTTILILDRFLNVRNSIDLRNAGILQATAVALSYDNNYWVFDALENNIKKLDDKGNVLMKSTDFRMLFAEAVNPQAIIDADSRLYLFDPEQGWYIFDYYGSYKKKIPAKGWTNVSVHDGNLCGYHDNTYIELNSNTYKETINAIAIDGAGLIKAEKQNDNLLLLNSSAFTVFRIN